MRLAAFLLVCAVALPARAERTDALDGPTTALLVAVPVALLVWDGVLAVTHARTESMILRDVAWKSSAIPYALGVVVGHLFFGFPESREKLWPVALGSLCAVVALDLLVRSDDRPAWRYPGLWLGAGIAAGALTWGQRF